MLVLTGVFCTCTPRHGRFYNYSKEVKIGTCTPHIVLILVPVLTQCSLTSDLTFVVEILLVLTGTCQCPHYGTQVCEHVLVLNSSLAVTVTLFNFPNLDHCLISQHCA